MWPEGYPLKVGGPNVARAANPVLIVNGEQDYPYVDSADDIAAALPRAWHKKLPGADHLSAVTHPLFKDIVIDFLNAG